MGNLYFIAKSMHLIGMVSWMAGLFYLVRIMVYHALGRTKAEPERGAFVQQYNLMEKKAWKVIVVPAVVITWLFGLTMLYLQPVWLEQPWLQVKLIFLLLLTIYTYLLKGQIKALEEERDTRSDMYYRVLNEVPTIIMTAIIFLAVFKTGINFWYLALGLGLFTGLIGMGIWKANRK